MAILLKLNNMWKTIRKLFFRERKVIEPMKCQTINSEFFNIERNSDYVEEMKKEKKKTLEKLSLSDINKIRKL